MHDGYGVPGARGVYLNGDDQTDDDHMRYYVTMETQGYYRIKTKATNRYVRLDSEKTYHQDSIWQTKGRFFSS
jgi:hypothetical protein